MQDLISKRTRNEFRETLVGWTLREITTEFDNEGFAPDLDFLPPTTGERRSLVEQFYKAIDFRDPMTVGRLLGVFQTVIGRVENYDSNHAKVLRGHLERDGIDIEGASFRVKSPIATTLQPLSLVAARLTADQLVAQIARIHSATDSDPTLAIGTAKELVETACKTILSDAQVSYSATMDIGDLLKAAMAELRLVPDNIPNEAKGADAIKKTLRSLAATVSGIAEMRNFYGSGHGPDGRAKGLTPRHARLAVGAAVTLATFLFETHEGAKGA